MADDGSGPATAALVEAWQGKVGRRLAHVWHEDRGFRAAEIRNRAILAARGAYCVFLDGDCIVRPDFVAAHRRLAEPGWFVTGNRVLLSPELTDKVLREKLTPEALGLRRLAGAALARRRQPRGGAAASAARALAASAATPLAGRALLPIWRSGAPISSASTASMPTTAAGARRIPTSSCVCCVPACAARTATFATGGRASVAQGGRPALAAGERAQALRHHQQRRHQGAARPVGGAGGGASTVMAAG